jgi:hypothetical protein
MTSGKSRLWLRRKFTCYLVLLAMLFSLSGVLNPAPVYADPGTVSGPATSLTIKAGTDASSNPTTIYTTLRTFSEEEMTSRATKQEIYSYFDSMPTPVMDAATGVTLADLLDEVGIDLDNVNRFYFYTTDITTGPYKNITKAALYDTERYYFPLIDDSWDYEEYKPAASGEWGDDPTAGKVPVKPMLAVSDNWLRVLNEGVPNFGTQDTSNRFRLMSGQTEVEYLNGTTTASTSAKWVHEICVRLTSAAVTGVSLDQSALTLAPGESEQLAATVAPSYASNDAISWSSDNTSVAAVNDSGLVTGVAGGNATITVTTTDGGFTATCAVTVAAGEPGLLTPPTLITDTTDNTVGQAVDITFPTDAAWEAAVSAVTVNGTPLTGEQYTISPGNINIASGVFTEAGDYSIVATATGYEGATVTQAMQQADTPVTYRVTVDSAISGGTVAVDPVSGSAGDTITVTVTPDSGKQLVAGSLKYNDGAADIEITATEGVYSFVLPAADVTVTARFEDLSSSSSVWDGSVDVSWYNTTDTEFYIDTPAKLAGLAAIVNGIYNTGATVAGNPDYIVPNVGGGDVAGSTSDTWIYGADDFTGKTVCLTADLDMGGVYNSSTQTWSGPNYMPIGGQYCMTAQDGTTLVGASWNGVFNGQGHTINNIYCSRHAGTLGYSFSQAIGLIGRMGVHDSDPTGWYTAPSVKNVAVTGYIYGNRSIGGIVGKNGRSNGSVIENCINYASVNNTDSKGVGGIAGAGWNNLTIKNCANMGSIYTSYSNAGGIVGSSEAKVFNSYNVGYVGATSGKENQAQSLGTNNGGAVWTNCYWLDGSSASNQAVYGSTTGSTIIMMDTAESMKTADFLTALNGGGNGWIADTNNINSGYPVPNWQGTPGPETYGVTVDGAISGGSVTADPATGIEGDIVIVTVTPAEGKQLVAGSLKYNDGAADIEITATDGVYSFVLPAADVTVTAQFEDVSAASYDITKAAVPDPIWTVTVDKTTAAAGETVTVTVADTSATSWATGLVVTGDSGSTYEFTTVTAATGNANNVNGAGVYSFVMPAEPVTVGFTADYTPLDVYVQIGDGPETLVHSYNRADMEALAAANANPVYYAVWDRMPAVFMGKAVRYVTIDQLAASAAGYNSTVRFNDAGCTIKGLSLDGWNTDLSWTYLMDTERKYYASMGDQYLASENRTGADRVVPAVLAITGWAGRTAQVDNQPYDTLNTYRFFYGQSESEYGNGVPPSSAEKDTRCTAINCAKYVYKIVFVVPGEGEPDVSSAAYTLSSAAAQAGDTGVEVAVSLENNIAGGFTGANLLITYDSANLTLTDVQPGAAIAGFSTAAGNGFGQNVFGPGITVHPNRYYCNDDFATPITVSGEVMVLTFSVNGDAPDGSYEIGIAQSPGNPFFGTGDMWDDLSITPAVNPGAINVTAGSELIPPTLTADTSGNTVGQAVDITFTADEAWETAISGITVNGTALTTGQYTVSAGKINIAAGVFTAPGDHIVTVTAAGYEDALVVQTMTNNGGSQAPVTMNLNPAAAQTGETVTASGTAPANTWISLKVLDADQNIVVFDAVKSDSQGNYSISFIVPEAAGDSLTIITGYGANIAAESLSLKLNPPALQADTDNNVLGQSIDITFSPDTDWQAAISGITVNSNSLTAGQYTISDGNINIVAGVFPAVGEYSITVSAEGYKDAQVTQAMAAKNPPALTADSSGNIIGQSIDLTFTENADWQAAVSGITVNGSPLTADQYTVSAGNINIAAVVFSAAGSYQIIVAAANYADAAVVQQILGIAPELIADSTNNSPGQTIEITFADNEAWRNAITGITVDQVSIAGKYTAAAGVITLDNTVFTETGSYIVAVEATGYADTAVTQEILNPCYLITPEADEIYAISENGDGIKTMTVQAGVTGIKYFNVGVTPVRIHNGNETLVFVHLRNEQQSSLNTSRGDFDIIQAAGAGFNVKASDMVKVYMVDQLTNDINFNPTIFQ